MNTLNNRQLDTDELSVDTIVRQASRSDSADVLADVYQDHINIAIWQRNLSPELLAAAQRILDLDYMLQFAASLSPEDAFDSIHKALGSKPETRVLASDVAEIVDMFCCLFDLEQVGLRLTTLDKAMCPKFHVDRVPCRLVATYSGVATQWLDHSVVDRSKLGMGSKGKIDDKSGLYKDHGDIQQLKAGDVSLLKGESWLGNEGGGLVHRSPSVQSKRLLLTLDFN